MSSASQLFSSRRPRWSRGTPPPSPPPPLHHLRQREPGADDPRGRRRICHRRRLLDEDHHPTCEHGFNAASNSVTADLGGRDSSESGDADRRIYDLRFDRNDRPPGTVLQARARLVERLGGSSSTRSRQRATPHNSEGVFATNIADQGDVFGEWDLEFLLSWPELGPLSSQSATLSEQPRVVSDSSPNRPGLSCKTIESLEREVFGEPKDAHLHVSPECSICLEAFLQGDGLIRLPCSHRFHLPCLIPWLRSRGDCPNCRTLI